MKRRKKQYIWLTSIFQVNLSPFDVVLESRQASYLNDEFLKLTIVVHSFFWLVVYQPSIVEFEFLRPWSLNHWPQEANFGAIELCVCNFQLDLISFDLFRKIVHLFKGLLFEKQRIFHSFDYVLSSTDGKTATERKDEPVEEDEENTIQTEHEARTGLVTICTAKASFHLPMETWVFFNSRVREDVNIQFSQSWDPTLWKVLAKCNELFFIPHEKSLFLIAHVFILKVELPLSLYLSLQHLE